MLTEEEDITLRRSGTSDVLHVPARWRRKFVWLKDSPQFEAHIERDHEGGIFIVFRKIPTRATEEVK